MPNLIGTGLALVTRGLESGVDLPDTGNVTTDDTVAGDAGTHVVPSVGNVRLNVKYGANGTEFTGILNPAGGSGGGHMTMGISI